MNDDYKRFRNEGGRARLDALNGLRRTANLCTLLSNCFEISPHLCDEMKVRKL